MERDASDSFFTLEKFAVISMSLAVVSCDTGRFDGTGTQANSHESTTLSSSVNTPAVPISTPTATISTEVKKKIDDFWTVGDKCEGVGGYLQDHPEVCPVGAKDDVKSCNAAIEQAIAPEITKDSSAQDITKAYYAEKRRKKFETYRQAILKVCPHLN